MNKFQEAIKELENGIKLYVNRMIEKSAKDMTYSAIIHSVGEDGYNVRLNNQIYQNVPTIGGICTMNETVKVLIPQNNYSNMVILKATDGGGGSGGAVSSVNGRTGAVVLNYQDVGALSALTSIPSKISQLTNDSNFITRVNMTDYAQPIGNYALRNELFNKDYNELFNKPQIPSKTSELTNDSSFVSDSAYVHTDNNLTSSLKQEILDNSLTRHDHSNKLILDGIIQSVIDKWNTVTDKVDKIDGKELSTNDFTTIEKNKLNNIEYNAEVNVQSDWNVADVTSDSYIMNKPTKLSQFENDIIITSDFELTINLDGSLNLIYNGE